MTFRRYKRLFSINIGYVDGRVKVNRMEESYLEVHSHPLDIARYLIVGAC